MITITVLKNPFNHHDKEIHLCEHVPGKTAYEYVEPYIVGLDDFVVSIGGTIAEDAKKQSVNSGDWIAVCPIVGKSKWLGIFASLVIGGLTGGLTARGGLTWNSFWGGVKAAAASMVGGALINHWFPPAKPDRPKINPSYDWNNAQAQTGQGNALAVTYGTMRTAGQVLAQHVSSNGENQYLNVLLCGGEGPIDNISDIRINDNPLSYYKDVIAETRLGENDQAVIANFNDTYVDQALAYELATDHSWVTHQTSGDAVEGLETTLQFPYGLYHMKDDGGLGNASVAVELQYRKVGDGDWRNINVSTISAANNTAFQRTYRIDHLSPAQYEIRARCVSKSGTDTRYSTRVFWTQLSSIIYDDFARPGKALVGIRALATNQLSGGMPSITWLQTRDKVWVWNEGTGQYEQKPATNPAWVAYDMIHRCRQIKNIHTGNFEFIAQGAPASRVLYQDFANWAAFCDDRKLTFNYIYDTATDLWTALQKPEGVGRGKVIMRGTRFGCVCDAPGQPVQLFTVGNIVADQFKETFVGLKDRANAIEITFVNKDKDYQKDIITAYADDYDFTTEPNITQITLDGATTVAQAYREGKYRLRLNQYLRRTVDHSADIDAIACQINDVVLLAHDVPQWGFSGRLLEATATTLQFDRQVTLKPNTSYAVALQITDPAAETAQGVQNIVTVGIQGVAEETTTDTVTLTSPLSNVPLKWDLYSFGETSKVIKPFRVLNISRDQDLRRKISCIEYIEEIYTEATDIPRLDYSALEDGVFEVTNISVAEQTYRQKDGTMVSDLVCAWTVPRGKAAKSYLVYYSGDNGATWYFHGVNYDTNVRIPNVKTQAIYLVKICTLVGPAVSSGMVSQPVIVTGKDQPPSDVANLTITQAGSLLYAVVTEIDDPDLNYYEVRMGPSWENSQQIARFTGEKCAFEAPCEGTLTFWVKAADNSGNFSTNARKVIINVFGLPQKNIIFERAEDLNTWQIQGMRRDQQQNWKIAIQEKLADYTHFADIFGSTLHFVENPEIILPVIDLGPNSVEDGYFYVDPWGNVKIKAMEKLADYTHFADIFGSTIHLMTPKYVAETFVNIDIAYNRDINNRVDIEYRTSLTGDTWGEWVAGINKQFFGRYVQIRLLPKSFDGITNVVISSGSVSIDVPDVEEIIENVSIPADITHLTFKRKFFQAPKSMAVFTQDETGTQATWRLSNVTNEGFDIELLDGNTRIPGKLQRASIRGY